MVVAVGVGAWVGAGAGVLDGVTAAVGVGVCVTRDAHEQRGTPMLVSTNVRKSLREIYLSRLSDIPSLHPTAIYNVAPWEHKNHLTG